MFDLVSDAEAEEGHEGEVTGRQMVDGAVARARRDFDVQPQLQGELLGELGRMYLRLDAAEAAEPVLSEAITVLEKHATPDDAALNKARVFLASALLKTSDERPRIGHLATQARAACGEQSEDCAKARAYASTILSNLALRAGDQQTALAEMRRSAADMELGFGANHEDTALTLMRVAILERNIGQLVDAGATMGRAVEMSRHLRLRATDRTEMDRSMAVIDLDLGHYETARTRLRALLDQTAGADEHALQYRLLASVYVELGDANEALKNAAAAKATIPGGAENGEWPFTQQAEARALALAGRHEEALAGIDAVLERFIADGSAEDSYEVLRAQRYRAQFLLRAGRDADALQALRELSDRHARAKVSPIERGLMLDALGEAELRAGNGEKSQLAHEEAAAQLLKQLPKDHPHVIRNAAL
jgi:tetratricopeptide (TPR) repeat protein